LQGQGHVDLSHVAQPVTVSKTKMSVAVIIRIGLRPDVMSVMIFSFSRRGSDLLPRQEDIGNVGVRSILIAQRRRDR
jgi:hypothetical protein